jgi:hypothetical protein
MAKLKMRLHRWFRRQPRHGVHGGGRPAAGERRRYVRLGKNREGLGVCLLTTQRRVGRRESGGEAATAEIDAGCRTSRAVAVSSVEDARNPVNKN